MFSALISDFQAMTVLFLIAAGIAAYLKHKNLTLQQELAKLAPSVESELTKLAPGISSEVALVAPVVAVVDPTLAPAISAVGSVVDAVGNVSSGSTSV